MTTQDDLDPVLWEYVYGLLSPAEARELEARITSEHDVARAYAEVRQRADLLRAAAHVQIAPLPWQAPIEVQVGAAPRDRTNLGLRMLPWLLSGAAMLLVGMLGYTWQRHAWLHDPAHIARAEQSLALGHKRLILAGPATIQPHRTNLFAVHLESVQGAPARNEQFGFALIDDREQVVTEAIAATDSNGNGHVAIPGDALTTTGTLKVWCASSQTASEVALDVACAAPQEAVNGTPVMLASDPEDAISFHSLALPQAAIQIASDGTHTFWADDFASRPLTESTNRFVTPHANQGAATVHDATGRPPIDPRWYFVEQFPAAHDRFGSDEEGPSRARFFRSPTSSLDILTTPDPVFPSNEALRVELTVPESSSRWLVAASQSGSLVGQQYVDFDQRAESSNATRQVTIPLASEAAGLLNVTLFDCQTSPPEALAEHYVYRAPSKHWRLELQPDESHAPDGLARWKVLVEDEQKRPGEATLEVSVMNGEVAPAIPGDRLYDLWAKAPTTFNFFENLPQGSEPAGASQISRPCVTPALTDNLAQVAGDYRSAVTAWRAHQEGSLQRLALTTAAGGFALLLTCSILLCLKLAGRPFVGIAAMTIATLSLVASGAFLQVRIQRPFTIAALPVAHFSGGERFRTIAREDLSRPMLLGSQSTAAKFSPLLATQCDVVDRIDETPTLDWKVLAGVGDALVQQRQLTVASEEPRLPRLALGRLSFDHTTTNGRHDSAVPTTLYCATLETGNKGRADVRFAVPPSVTQYRIFIRARGQGRSGWLERVVDVSLPPADE